MERLTSLVRQFKQELDVYHRVLRDPQTPRRTRWLLGAAAAYAISPLDLIPDFIPLLGQLDDLIVLPLLVWLAIRSMPPGLLEQHRLKAMSEGRNH